MSEVWVPVNDHPKYEVSDAGRVRSVSRNRIVNPKRALNGYPVIRFSLGSRDNKKVVVLHRIVAEHFLSAPKEGQDQVAHNDGDPFNNAASNLRWATRSENHADKTRHGRTASANRPILNKEKVAAIRSRCPVGHSERVSLAQEFGISYSNLLSVLRNKSWKDVGPSNLPAAATEGV